MGLFDLFEEIFDFVADLFDGDNGGDRRVKPAGPSAAGGSALSTESSAANQAYWEKTSQLITPEFVESLCRDTGWSTLKVSLKMQGPCSEVLQRWQRLGRPINDFDLNKMRQEIREKVLDPAG